MKAKEKRCSIEVNETTRDTLRDRAKTIGMKYDGYIKLLLKMTESQVGVKC